MALPEDARRALPVEPTHQHVFDLDEFLDAVVRTFAAEARLLHATERRQLGRDGAGVDADHAVLEPLTDAPDAADVARVEICGEPELGVVGKIDRLPLVLEAIERRHRAESLFFCDEHVSA